MTDEETPELPREVLEALQQVRTCLLQDDAFVGFIYGPKGRRTDVRRFFDIVDNWLKTRLGS